MGKKQAKKLSPLEKKNKEIRELKKKLETSERDERMMTRIFERITEEVGFKTGTYSETVIQKVQELVTESNTQKKLRSDFREMEMIEKLRADSILRENSRLWKIIEALLEMPTETVVESRDMRGEYCPRCDRYGHHHCR